MNEEIKIFAELVEKLNQVDDIKVLALALSISKHKDNVVFEDKEITVTVPKVTEVPLWPYTIHTYPNVPTIPDFPIGVRPMYHTDAPYCTQAQTAKQDGDNLCK